MKSLSLLIIGAIAVFTGVTLAILFIRKKRKDGLLDFDDFDTVVSDEEFEHFFGTEVKDDED